MPRTLTSNSVRMLRIFSALLVLVLFAPRVLAFSPLDDDNDYLLAAREAANGMDMSMDDGMTLANGTMMPMLHFTLGDTLFFAGWVPQTRAAMFGACVGLFILTLVDRWVGAMRAMSEVAWRRTNAAARAKARTGSEYASGKTKAKGGRWMLMKMPVEAPSFIWSQDAMRGLMHAVQALLGYTFMLAVMTFQAAYIITIVGGLGVGEMLFGRYRAGADSGH